MKRAVVLGWFVLVGVGCRVEAIRHNPIKAFSSAAVFLRTLYLDEDYPKAFDLAHEDLRQSISQEGLRQIVEHMKQEDGDLQQLTADSYLQTPGRTIEIFFVGRHERGTLYHRIVLMGDESMGYKVSGVWFTSKPYPAGALRKPFGERFVIQK